jgi:enoyl-CoA hydratase/carnithine racemase
MVDYEGEPALIKSCAAGVVTLRLNRPHRGNALSATLVEQLISAVYEAAADGDIHTLVLCSTGQNFCTGFDLSDLDAETDATLLQRFVRVEMLLAALANAPIRTVACGHGKVWGAGADMFVACDVRAATADTTFRFPGAGFGIVLGTRRLAARTGVDFARRCTIDGVTVSANTAQTHGLVTEVSAGFNDEWLLSHSSTPVPDARTVAALRAASHTDSSDADLALLVRTAAEPGLKNRIIDYRHRPRTR